MFNPSLLKNIHKDDAFLLDVYLASGGYQALGIALSQSPQYLIEQVKAANLRGRGGAGFPTGLKWSFIPRDSSCPKYLCCNADEGEPGTFKDRIIMEKDPHLLLEGIMLAAYAIGASLAYIYVRHEYVVAIARMEQAIAQCKKRGYLGSHILGSDFSLDIVIHAGAGAYICGEETALLESLEGKRGVPRLKPPFPAIKGYCQSPTVINNVETLACVPPIISQGADWFHAIGPEKSPGPKLYCLSGHIKRPGLYELPMGISLRTLVEEVGGGSASGKPIKAVIPGGASAAMLPESELDVAMDFESLAAAGSMLGSAGIIVMDESASIVAVVKRMLEFFNNESCGKCTPCREGTNWVVKLLTRILAGEGRPGDIQLLDRLTDDITGNCFCALGDGAMMALAGGLKHFRHEFDVLIRQPPTVKVSL